jgi:hypothetical protein
LFCDLEAGTPQLEAAAMLWQKYGYRRVDDLQQANRNLCWQDACDAVSALYHGLAHPHMAADADRRQAARISVAEIYAKERQAQYDAAPVGPSPAVAAFQHALADHRIRCCDGVSAAPHEGPANGGMTCGADSGMWVLLQVRRATEKRAGGDSA